MRIGTLADVENLTDLLLRQVSVCSQILNSLKFHGFTSFSSVISKSINQNEMHYCNTEQNGL